MITKIMQMDAKMAYDSLPKQDKKMKQETLEEAAKNYVNGRCTGGIMERALLSAIEFGAKWQKERSYSEEDLKDAYFSAVESTGEGWNGEYADGNNPKVRETFDEGFEEWFEQFKNK